jgi:hypothetical protein
MGNALFAMAIAQALVPEIAILIWRPESASGSAFWGAASMGGVMMLNGFFVLLFAVSALLFRHAAREHSTEGAAPAS